MGKCLYLCGKLKLYMKRLLLFIVVLLIGCGVYSQRVMRFDGEFSRYGFELEDGGVVWFNNVVSKVNIRVSEGSIKIGGNVYNILGVIDSYDNDIFIYTIYNKRYDLSGHIIFNFKYPPVVYVISSGIIMEYMIKSD